MDAAPLTERIETVIIGGGQAGLTTAYHLAKRGRPFVILDANERVGDAWRTRWDSLRLFSPARYDWLPGWRFPASGWSYPTKDEMADYLEAYAVRFALPVRTGVRVEGVTRDGDRYVVRTDGHRFEADNVVVATGANRVPKVPALASELDPSIVQFHSSEYRRPSQLRDGDVLLVGAGNSGAEISFEASRSHRTWLSGPDTGHLPVRHGGPASRFVLPFMRFLGHHVLNLGTPIGRRVGPKLATKATPLIRLKQKDLAAAGVELVPRVVGARDGSPVLEDGRVLDVANVVWCTGFRTDFGWIDLPIFSEDGQPLHHRGIVDSELGLSFVGLVFQYSLTSDILPSRGRDAEYVATHIAARARSTERSPLPRAIALAGS